MLGDLPKLNKATHNPPDLKLKQPSHFQHSLMFRSLQLSKHKVTLLLLRKSNRKSWELMNTSRKSWMNRKMKTKPCQNLSLANTNGGRKQNQTKSL
jgi:hypothetical protein